MYRLLVAVGRWVAKHRTISLRLHAIVHQFEPCVLCHAVWAEIENNLKTIAALRAAQADMDAGRWYYYDTETGVATPNPDWPADGAQSPESYRKAGVM